MEKIKYIRNEFIQITNDQILDLEDPIEITFYNVGDANVIINGTYQLAHIQTIIGGATNFEYKLNLKNNPNEIDRTRYHIRFIGGAPIARRLVVIAKYFVNS